MSALTRSEDGNRGYKHLLGGMIRAEDISIMCEDRGKGYQHSLCREL
jgi:hypothetical protein